MKIALLSDLHLESAPYRLELPQADVLLLAGDIVSAVPYAQKDYDDFMKRAHEEYESDNVFVLEGNHTGYGGSIEDFQSPQYCIERDDVVFIGATLWSGAQSRLAYTMLNDRFIKWFTWDWMYYRHLKDLEFIELCLQKHQDKKCVVFTHHIPSIQGVHEKWLVDGTGGINYGFYTDLDWMIDKYQPTVWAFGHTHDSYDKFHSNGKTRLVCNPRGYVNFLGNTENQDFDSMKVIEI